MTVNHRNLDKADNRLENLEYASHQANMNHAVRHRRGRFKLQPRDIQEIIRLTSNGFPRSMVAKLYGVTHTRIGQICRSAAAE